MSAERAATVERYLDALPFSPDPFQRTAAAELARGHSVVVTAPTGAGKTVIAEAAVELALAEGLRAFYTAPIKALSNQKFNDLRAVYGEGRVGLLTGDNVINGDADIVVMTTEVLRNMIYADSTALDRLHMVVLDEVHYLKDPFRGQVWEEIIIHLPQRVLLACLSATIANADEFTGWIRERRGDAVLVAEHHRPVPLESTYLIKDRHRDLLTLLPVFSRSGKPNERITRLLAKGRGRRRRFAPPRRLETAELLAEEGLLPAIYFIFSRAGCDQAAEQVAAARPGWIGPADRERIRAHAAERTAHVSEQDLTVLGYARWVGMLEQGVAAHHAGMVPAFKETVEELFTAGLVRLVFATETLALGINMPARSVVLEQLSKFTGEGHELLEPGDYTQLTGRAGRRGIDELGTAVVQYSPYVPFDKVADIAGAGSHPLRSAFRPTYNMAVNLVAAYERERAEQLLQASFARYHADEQRRRDREHLAALRAELAQAREAAACERGDVFAFAGDADPAGTGHAAVMREWVGGIEAGDVVALEPGDVRVVLARGYGSNPRMLLTNPEGALVRRAPDQIPSTAMRLGAIDLPEPFAPGHPDFVAAVADILEQFEPDPEPDAAYQEDPRSVAGCPDLEDHLRWIKRAAKLERRIERKERRVVTGGSQLLDRFLSVLEVLGARGYVDGWDLTEKGGRLRYVYNELDLLIAEAAFGGLFDGLEPAALAAVLSLFVYEARGTEPEDPDPPAGVIAERIDAIAVLAADLAAEERNHGLPGSRQPDHGFAAFAHAWAAGGELEDLFGEDDFDAGGFVRTCRQLLDLIRQVRDAFPDLADSAAAAVKALDRGVVAAGGRL